MAGAIEYVIDRALCLCGGVNQKLAIIAKLVQPAGKIGGLIGDDRVRDSGFGAKESRSHLGN